MMNRTIHIILLLWISALILSCTERGHEEPPEPEPLSVPIRLYTGIRTRAAVDTFDGTPVCIACGPSAGNYTACWEGVATGNEIKLVPTRYYPLDGSPVYLRSFYPPAPMTAEGTLLYTLTGEEDLMLACEQSGSRDAPFTEDRERTLLHRHLLTKLVFHLKLDVEDADKFSIRSMALNGLSQEVQLSLLTEELTCGEAVVSVTVYDSGEEGACLPFEDGGVRLPGHVLVQPGAEFSIELRLAVDDDPAHDFVYTHLPVHFEGGAGEGGVAYTVLVDIPDPATAEPQAIVAMAKVCSWENGTGGNGEIDGGEGIE